MIASMRSATLGSFPEHGPRAVEDGVTASHRLPAEERTRIQVGRSASAYDRSRDRSVLRGAVLGPPRYWSDQDDIAVARLFDVCAEAQESADPDKEGRQQPLLRPLGQLPDGRAIP